MRLRRAFTLIELLVVIAIIAVLIALLAAGRAGGARGCAARLVHQQFEATGHRASQLSRFGRAVSARAISRSWTRSRLTTTGPGWGWAARA